MVITEGDMFGLEKKRRRKKKTAYEGKKIQSFSELSVGDYVVHESHGLGIYRGIEKIEQDKMCIRDRRKTLQRLFLHSAQSYFSIALRILLALSLIHIFIPG